MMNKNDWLRMLWTAFWLGLALAWMFYIGGYFD